MGTTDLHKTILVMAKLSNTFQFDTPLLLNTLEGIQTADNETQPMYIDDVVEMIAEDDEK